MILRRFMKHVSDQNWFAVGLDVVVVITGIFLGLQVSDWKEERSKKAERMVFLEQIYDEMQPQLAMWRKGNEFGATRHKLEAKLLENLLRGELLEEDRLDFERGLISLLSWGWVDVSLLRHQLETTDIIARFRNTPYEKTLLGLYESWTSAFLPLQDLNAATVYPSNIIQTRVMLRVGEYKETTRSTRRPEYDFETLKNDSEFIHAVAQLHAIQVQARAKIFSGFLGIEESVLQLGRLLGQEPAG